MVTDGTGRKSSASCSLERIKELASQGAITYGGLQVQIDIADLRFEDEDVCACLLMLEEENFSHAERYPDFPVWLDVYKLNITVRFPESSLTFTEKLYIKFKLDKDCINVVLFSFHRQNRKRKS